MPVKLAEHVPEMLAYRRAARRADIVHFQWLTVQPVDWALLPNGRPRVLTAHDIIPREPRPGQIVVACLDGCFTLKRLIAHQGRLRLEAAHPDYPPLELDCFDGARIWAVALHVIRTLEAP